MADKGIIFSAPMVRALLDGRKTQTRRLVRPVMLDGVNPNFSQMTAHRYGGQGRWMLHGSEEASLPFKVPYAPGDRLYVREVWTARMTDGWTIADARSRMYQEEILYRADGVESIDGWWSSIHMPREFSRLTLMVSDVRVERVASISEGDAICEGVEPHPAAPHHLWKAYADDANPVATARESFRGLWNSLHTKPGERWEDNPWIVAVTFAVKHGNIDRIGQ